MFVHVFLFNVEIGIGGRDSSDTGHISNKKLEQIRSLYMINISYPHRDAVLEKALSWKVNGVWELSLSTKFGCRGLF